MEHKKKPMNEEELGHLIQEGLKEMDRQQVVRTPDMGYFRALVAEAEAKKSKKGKREYWIFIGLAFLILFGMTFIFYSAAELFMLLQIFAVVLVPAGILMSRFRNRQVKTR